MTQSLEKIKCFLLDMDGTFYVGNRPVDGAFDFINLIEDQGKDYLFLTNNSSKHRKQYAEKISKLGLPLLESKVFTSGEATALYLQKTQPGARVFLVGTPSLEEEFADHGFALTAENPDLVVLGFDTTLTYDKLRILCDFVRSGLRYVATHPDFNCPTEKGFMPDIGAMIAFVKASTGRDPDFVVGKPNKMVLDAVSQKLNIPLDQIAMIGDRLYTDIAMGKTSSITTILVLSGETRLSDLEGSPYQPDYIFENLGAVATWLKFH
jgi:4-nitrophenyl phosphatase